MIDSCPLCGGELIGSYVAVKLKRCARCGSLVGPKPTDDTPRAA